MTSSAAACWRRSSGKTWPHQAQRSPAPRRAHQQHRRISSGGNISAAARISASRNGNIATNGAFRKHQQRISRISARKRRCGRRKRRSRAIKQHNGAYARHQSVASTRSSTSRLKRVYHRNNNGVRVNANIAYGVITCTARQHGIAYVTPRRNVCICARYLLAYGSRKQLHHSCAQQPYRLSLSRCSAQHAALHTAPRIRASPPTSPSRWRYHGALASCA